ncbi:MAG: FAD-binding domain-containing protein [Phycisphaerales bacterium]|nr:deoxyribodipyrimidine photo-lyase [Planctomycetota bacterium]
MSGRRALVWFRSDLRVRDNRALWEACASAGGRSGAGVVALFVISPGEWRAHDVAPVRIELILRSLRVLRKDLAKLNIPLLIAHRAKPEDVPGVVIDLATEHRCEAVHFNKEYEVNEQRRDAATISRGRERGMRVTGHTDQTCIEPGELRTGEGRFFTVYTPFKKAFYKRWESVGGIAPLGTPAAQAETGVKASDVPETIPGFVSKVDPALWPGGEDEALARLQKFAARSILPYKERRDFPGDPGTSRLSPYLAAGSLSHRQCIAAAIEANLAANPKLRGNPIEAGSEGPVCWMSEVLWREFYVHVMAGFPRVCMNRAFQTKTERIVWDESPERLAAWKAGRTGVPIVDAGMRQLLREGWMHNRVRMITAMYFTKDYFLDWRLGEKWFMQNLVDGFLASNNGGWQWSASTGTDAAPYFRIFNTYSQSEKFDAAGDYIREYVPELRDVEGPAIHDPSQLPGLLRSRLDYPEPLVDRVKARTRAIEAFKGL